MSDTQTLAMLARMSDDWNDTAQALMTTAICLLMRHLNVTVIDLDISPDKVEDLLANYTLDREYYTDETNDRKRMRVTLAPKLTLTPKQEEVTSDG